MAKLTIDGREVEVPDGTRLFDACRLARDGRDLPHFCYHPDLSVAGVCRLCQVEIEGMPHLARWLAQVGERPAVQRGRAVPERLEMQGREKEYAKAASKILA